MFYQLNIYVTMSTADSDLRPKAARLWSWRHTILWPSAIIRELGKFWLMNFESEEEHTDPEWTNSAALRKHK